MKLKSLSHLLAAFILTGTLAQTAQAQAQDDSVSILFAGDVVLDGKPGKMIA